MRLEEMILTTDFYIVGAGGFAREIYSYLSDDQYKVGSYRLAGFLDDNVDAVKMFKVGHKVVSTLFSETIPSGSKLIMAVANPELKERIFHYYKSRDCSFVTYIHPSAFIGNSVSIGEGSIVSPNSVLTTDIKIGNCVTINALSSVGHDAKIGDFSTLSGHCDVTGFVELGQKVFMGSNSSVIPNVKVGDDSIIGAGSVVISKVRAGVTVFGNPARKIK
ncbi:acetyltransferase [Shewanella chilikensis]|uniref:acetyltransferase n=1 Tax=Shewanella chilikensis TaxID=558541 RepID=UPI00399ABA37